MVKGGINIPKEIKIVKDEITFPEKIKITDIPKFIEVLDDIWLDAVKKDHKNMSKEELYKKYDLQTPFELLELLIDDTKADEYKKWIDSMRKELGYTD